MRYRAKQAREAFAVFFPTVCEGMVPGYYDKNNYPVFYATELEAQREIADDQMTRLQQFLDGERDFVDAILCDEIILPVRVWPDGSISTEDGRIYGKQE